MTWYLRSDSVIKPTTSPMAERKSRGILGVFLSPSDSSAYITLFYQPQLQSEASKPGEPESPTFFI